MPEEGWYLALTEGEAAVRSFRRMVRKVPSNPRCKLCYVPFGGIGGKAIRFQGKRPSRKNPSFCNACFEAAPLGGAEVDVGILFADVRGYTSIAETEGPTGTAELMNRFYDLATEVLSKHDGVIDKLVGDQVMALFVPGFVGPEYVEQTVAAAEDLLHGVGYGPGESPWLHVGVGIDAGIAYVGNVGSGEVKDFTAIGDPVNVAARLQALAAPGEILMTERVHDLVSDLLPAARELTVILKGKTEPTSARAVDISAT